MLAMDNAARSGHLEMVKWLHENRSEGCSTRAMDGAASSGHLEVVEWLHQNRTEGGSRAAIDRAAYNGHLEVVKWLTQNCGSAPFAQCTTKVMDDAAMRGDLKMVK